MFMYGNMQIYYLIIMVIVMKSLQLMVQMVVIICILKKSILPKQLTTFIENVIQIVSLKP